jgi:hypothetical protein
VNPIQEELDSARFAAALVEVEQELDWELLGRHYCDEGGEDFFGPEQREAQREAALRFAADLGDRLQGQRKGRSLYVGAGLAELAPILCDALVLRREVAIVALPGPEPKELNRALAAAETRLGFALPRWSVKPLAKLDREGFDHLWLVSVLTDPEAFPALSKHLYGTGHPPGQALNRDRRAAEELLGEALWRLAPPAQIEVSEEELPLLAEQCAARRLRLEVAEVGRLSPIVGDVVRHGRVTQG